MTCRRRHGAPFNAFATYTSTNVAWQGPALRWRSGARSIRLGCATCGSPIFWADDAAEVVELHLGSFDEIGTLAPQYERDRPGEQA